MFRTIKLDDIEVIDEALASVLREKTPAERIAMIGAAQRTARQLAVGNDPWSQQQLDRRIRETIVARQQGYLAAPEDVIIGKLIYYNEGGSEKHLRDITGILRISGEIVDKDYFERHVRSLGVDHIWAAILEKLAKA